MEQSLGMMLVQSIAALAMVLALFAALVWGLKRLQMYQLPSHVQGMKVVQRISLDAKHSIVEVQRSQKHYVLALSTDGVQLLEMFDVQEDELKEELSND